MKGAGSTQNLTEVDPSLLLRSVARSVSERLSGIRRIRNSFSNSCDVAVKTGADLAKTKKSQVTFAAFNSGKITSGSDLTLSARLLYAGQVLVVLRS